MQSRKPIEGGLTRMACLLFTVAAGAQRLPDPSLHTCVPRRELPLAAVQITDCFWAPKLAIYRSRTIPHSWQHIQREIEDNEIAAGWKQIERGEDIPWNQANLHKVLETCAYALAQEPNSELAAKVDDIIEAVAAAQQPNGDVNALVTVRHIEPWSWMAGRHEGYVAGHLIEAAVAHHLATGRRSLLDVAIRNADHIYDVFIARGSPGVCGHAALELALVRLYRVTGERRNLDLAKEWVERRGHGPGCDGDTPRSYFMDPLPICEVPVVTGHAVRTMFYLTGVAGVAAETGDTGLAAAARRLWANTTRQKMLVTGSAGTQASDEGLAESCAACGLLEYAQAMFLLDGRSDSFDILERALYHAVLHGIALDGVTTYYRNPLTDADHPRDNCWVSCPPYLSRTLLRLPDYVYARTDRDLYVNLYVGSRATVDLKDNRVQLACETDYPWSGQVRLTVSPSTRRPLALRLRLPDWCRGASLRLNGKLVPVPILHGYVVLDRPWRAGGAVELDLPMPIERIEAHPLVKTAAGKVAVQRGPIVHGFEALDNEGDVSVTLPPAPGLAVEHRPDLLGGVAALTGRRADGRACLALPFYALANRDLSQQRVWVNQAGMAVRADGWADKLYQCLEGP